MAYKEDEIKNYLTKSYEKFKADGNTEAVESIENLAFHHKVALPEVISLDVKKSHVDPGLGIIYLKASRAEVYDKAGHKIPLTELRKGAINYVKNSRRADSNHDEKPALEVVESLVFDDPIVKAVIDGDIVAGDWVVGMEPMTDEMLQKALSGQIKGASIAGRGVLIDED